MTSTSILILLAILAYLAVVVGMGVVLAKKNHTTEDFYLGGRKLGPFVTAMSAEASDMSSWLLMGLPGATLNQSEQVHNPYLTGKLLLLQNRYEKRLP